MPIVIKAKKNDSNGDIIRRFKKVAAAADVVARSRDRQYHIKPALQRAQKKNDIRRLQKRLRSMKHQKNVTPEDIERITEMLQ